MSDQNTILFILFILFIGIVLFIYFKIRNFFFNRMGKRAKEFENRGRRHYNVNEQTIDGSSYYSFGKAGNRNELKTDWESANIFSIYLTIGIVIVVSFFLLKSCGT